MSSEFIRKQGDIFKGSATFAEAFPQIRTIEVEVSESGTGNDGLGLRRFGKNTVREYINCTNPQCSGRGFSLGDLVRQLLKTHQPAWQGRQVCEGKLESSSPCENHFDISIHLQTHDLK